MAGTVGWNVFAQGVQVLSAALVVALNAAFNAGKNFAEFGIRFDAGIDEGFGFQRDAARLLQKSKRKAGDDAKRVLDVQSAFQEGDRNALLHALLARQIRKKNWSFE